MVSNSLIDWLQLILLSQSPLGMHLYAETVKNWSWRDLSFWKLYIMLLYFYYPKLILLLMILTLGQFYSNSFLCKNAVTPCLPCYLLTWSPAWFLCLRSECNLPPRAGGRPVSGLQNPYAVARCHTIDEVASSLLPMVCHLGPHVARHPSLMVKLLRIARVALPKQVWPHYLSLW